jgi:hypothetical protein
MVAGVPCFGRNDPLSSGHWQKSPNKNHWDGGLITLKEF